MRIQAVSLIIFSIVVALGQDAPRQIWDTGFLQKRPAAPKTSAAPRKESGDIHYQMAATPQQRACAYEPVIGLTLWKLRFTGARNENTPRLLLQDSATDASPKAFVPERANLTDPLHDGDRVRLSIESPRAGFLYVVDRERYSDGTTGDPVLVFPAGNFNEGTNDVGPGRPVEIPPQKSKIPALKVTRSGANHIGEDLLIVVAKDPIQGLTIENRETKLPRELVSQWERDWSTDSLRLDLGNNDKGAKWTQNEKEAGDNRRLLTQDDPMPSVILSVKPVGDKPLLLRVSLDLAERR